MKFFMIDGYVKFPIKKINNIYYFIGDEMPDATESDVVVTFTENENISQSVLDAVGGKQFETYTEAQDFLNNIA